MAAGLASRVLTFLAVAAHCVACTIVSPVVTVGPAFRVRVENRGRPVEGLKLRLTQSARSAGKADLEETDDRGTAIFGGLKPGYYSLRPERDTGIPDSLEIAVSAAGPVDITVPMQWRAPLLVRSLKGVIRGPRIIHNAQPPIPLAAFEAISGRSVGKVTSTSSGEFDFGSIPPGSYFLKLDEGRIPVDVDPSAPLAELDLDFGSTSCGLWYSDRSENRCPRAALSLHQLTGVAKDFSGAPIGDATISLFDSQGALIERLRGGWDGKFTSPLSLTGTYELAVDAPGFTSLHQSVIGSDQPAPQILTVRLGFMAPSCATVE